MFDVGASGNTTDTVPGRKTSRSEVGAGSKPPVGVYGHRVRQTSTDKLPPTSSEDDESEGDDDDEDEEVRKYHCDLCVWLFKDSSEDQGIMVIRWNK